MAAQQTGIIILAAGASSRMGQPKQLLTFNGATLLQNAVSAATGLGAGTTIVVLGANANEVMPAEYGSDVHAVVNGNWPEGMASSIRCGLQNLLIHLPGANAVIIMLCDQPYVTTALLSELLQAAEATGKSIVACAYGNVKGVPALFKREMFAELMLLEGDVGARRVINRNAEHVTLVPFTDGAVDIDTPEDYERLQID